ncbi:hypothetical protein GCM10014715_32960 [Streptomyces spiralis]|uniref:Uncharacterized protein n=1 Tax=Streptomyces spiralis TaxID=66376 RepID=A0A918ZXN1_9ACTN|nr:hypothetical protein GCM10014715_32960 [Streptomyces spiralis]
MRQLQKPLLSAPTKAQSTPAFWYVIFLPLPRMTWVNMHPVGTFIVTPPTLYSKVRTGVDPIAVACALVEAVRTRLPAVARVVTKRVTRGVIKVIPLLVPMSDEHRGQLRQEAPGCRAPGRFTITGDQVISALTCRNVCQGNGPTGTASGVDGRRRQAARGLTGDSHGPLGRRLVRVAERSENGPGRLRPPLARG